MKKALIIQNKYIGDVLVASVLAKNLKKIDPQMQVHFFCYDKALPVLENNPYIDKVYSFNDDLLRKFKILRSYAKQIRKEKYDYLIDPYAKLQSRFITLFSGAKTKISYQKGLFDFLYDHTIPRVTKAKYTTCTSIEDRVRLLTPIEPNMSLYDYQTEIFLTSNEIDNSKAEMISRGIDFTKPVIMIGVLGSHRTKSLPYDYMADLLNFLIENYDANFLLNYVPSQQSDVDEILLMVNNPEKLNTQLLGNNVREFLGIAANCNVLIANEGGAINMAKALGIPTYSIYSPHKFREDWGCYEDLPIHKSIHVEDFYPELFHSKKLKDILQNPTPLYEKLTAENIEKDLVPFLYSLGISTKNEEFQEKEKIADKEKISALLITKNEEANLPEFLSDMDFVDEIVIVDSFSDDKTKDIALKNDKVKFVEKKFEDFTSQKNFAIEQAQYPWILFFDADERIPKELKNEILYSIKNANGNSAFYVKRKFHFKDKPIKYSGFQNDKVIRVFRKGKAQYENDKLVHEILSVEGKTAKMKNALLHYSLNDLKIYESKLRLYSELRAKELYEQKIKPNVFHFKIKPAVRFLHHYVFRFGFLDGKNGFTLAQIYADYVKYRYQILAQLWENSNTKV